MIEIQRKIPLSSGKRFGLKLTETTWQAIDFLAEKRGKTWREWCASVIEDIAEDEKNLTAIIRDTAMDQLLSETVFNFERAGELESMANNAFTENHGVVDDNGIAPYLASAVGQSDFGGFSIIFGVDSDGSDYLAVRNGLRGGVHFVTVSGGSAK